MPQIYPHFYYHHAHISHTVSSSPAIAPAQSIHSDIDNRTIPTFHAPQHGSIRVAIYNIVHHSHSPGVMELNVEQLAHLQLVALSGRSYGCGD